MKKYIAFLTSICMFLTGCASSGAAKEQQEESSTSQTEIDSLETQEQEPEEKTEEEKVQDYVSSLTLEEKIGQMIMVAYRRDTNGNPVHTINEDIKQSIHALHPGGVILFGENIDTEEQTADLISQLQAESTIPMWFGIDEEGGRVSRLHASGKIDTPQIPAALELGRSGSTEKVREAYGIIGEELKQLGFHIDFAPVADIYTNPENTVIGDRAFGTTAQETSPYVAAAVDGLEDEGILSALKHFPGHGDTGTDSHTGEAVSYKTMEQLLEEECVPFQAGMEAGAAFVMVSHIQTPNATEDGLPASLSYDIVTNLLKEKLQFEGLVITDAMDMGAITQYYSAQDAALLAIEAGVDILLMPSDPQAAFEAVYEGVQNGSILEERIDRSVNKIIQAKVNLDLIALD